MALFVVQELAELDTDDILQKQVEQLEKEKKELQERLRSQDKKVNCVTLSDYAMLHIIFLCYLHTFYIVYSFAVSGLLVVATDDYFTRRLLALASEPEMEEPSGVVSCVTITGLARLSDVTYC